ncbi:MAG: S8 family serine peptidase [Gemmataceae bacterium]
MASLSALALLLLCESEFGSDAFHFSTNPPQPFEDCATPDSGVFEPVGHPEIERKQFLARLGVDRWHAAGITGRGVKVAILDSGFRGYKAQLGKALPAQIKVHSFRADGNLEARDSQHGILCAEVLHTIAPDAELLFANWDPDRPDQFLDAVRWARKEGARLASCSLIMPSWSDGEGHGPVHDALRGVLGEGSKNGDLLCFASAGNTAERHWSGSFHADPRGRHEWAAGQITNLIMPWGSDSVSVEMCWSGDADYEVLVTDNATGEKVARSEPTNKLKRVCAIARFNPQSGRLYQAQVTRISGKPGDFHFVVLGGGLKYAKAQSSIPFPADGQDVVAVGAVDEQGRRLSYSSCGPNSRQPKPDLVAAVPFYSLWRSRPFAGTSAAAPQAAGLAALIWSRHSGWTANQVREALRLSAHDLGPKGHDWETGYGCVALPILK